MICEYGCGLPGKHQFKNGKWCCSKHYSGCSFIIKKQNNSRLLKSKENKDDILCKFGCGLVGKYVNKNREWCCSSHHTKCSTYKLFIKNNNPMNNLDIKEKHKNKMKTLTSKNNPLYTCEGALERLRNSQRKNETREKKRISTLKAVEKGIHPMSNLEIREKNSKTMLDKFKDPIFRRKMLLSHPTNSIKDFQERYPIFVKVEEIRYKPDFEKEKVIQAHCKNNKCKNSKEQNGWFTPTKSQLYERIRQIEGKNGNGGCYLYCCDNCKEECPIYGKHITQLIREDLIRAGHLEDPWYNSVEYQTWRKQVFELDNNKCVWCGQEASIVHHILPQKTHPELSTDPENGLSCCKDCHYKYGHRDRWCTTGFLAKLVCERIYRIKNVKE